jgi:hypothetical protein
MLANTKWKGTKRTNWSSHLSQPHLASIHHLSPRIHRSHPALCTFQTTGSSPLMAGAAKAFDSGTGDSDVRQGGDRRGERPERATVPAYVCTHAPAGCGREEEDGDSRISGRRILLPNHVTLTRRSLVLAPIYSPQPRLFFPLFGHARRGGLPSCC